MTHFPSFEDKNTAEQTQTPSGDPIRLSEVKDKLANSFYMLFNPRQGIRENVGACHGSITHVCGIQAVNYICIHTQNLLKYSCFTIDNTETSEMQPSEFGCELCVVATVLS